MAEDAPFTRPESIAHMQSYRVLDHGETLSMELALAGGGDLELRIPSLALPTLIRSLIEASRAAEQIKAGKGLARDVVQALTVQGDPVVTTSTEGKLLVVVRAQQTFPVVFALTSEQAATLAAGLQKPAGGMAQPPRRH